MSESAKDSERDRGFAQGVAWAVGILQRSFGESSLAENILLESGMKKNDFRRACDPYDYRIVRRFFEADERWHREMGKRRKRPGIVTLSTPQNTAGEEGKK